MNEPRSAADSGEATATGNPTRTPLRRTNLAVVTLLSAIWAVSSGDPLSAQPPELAAPAVSGKLVAPDGSLASDVEVRLIPSPGNYARRLRELGETDAIPVVDRSRTNTDGRFVLTAPHIGPYRLEILAAVPDTTPPTVAAPVYALLLPLAEPMVLPPIQLPRMHDLAVGVRDEAGKPIEGALVVARTTRRSNRERRSVERVQPRPTSPWRRAAQPREPELAQPTFDRATTRTDAQGIARLSLPTADANVIVAAPGFELRASLIEGGRGLFQLRRDAGVTLRVRDQLGAPVPRAVVRIGESMSVPLALTDGRGEATVGLSTTQGISFQVETADRAFGQTSPIRSTDDNSAEPRTVDVTVAPAIELAGRAVDATTRLPVPGTTIWLNGRSGDHAWSDAAGSFTLRTRDDVGALHLSATALGYRAQAMSVPLERVRSREVISVVLNPAATFTGTVTDSSGHPVAEAQLLVDRLDPADAGNYAARSGTYYQWRTAYGRDQQTTSASDGTFRLDGLDRHLSYLLTVEARGFVRYAVELPATGTSGAQNALDIVLGRGHRTWGKIVDPDERPVSEASIAMAPAIRDARGGVSVSADSYLTATSDAEGVFEFPAVGTGSYQLTVDHAEFTGRTPMSIAIPAGEGDVDVGVFTLTPGKQIEGLVFGPDRRAVAGARISAFDGRPVPSPIDAGSRGATTDDDGRFRIGGLPDRPVQVAVEADGFAHYSMKGVRPGTGELLEIELGRGATLAGRVVDAAGDAISGAFVTIHSRDPDVWRSSFQPPIAETDADGRFHFELLRSGPWSASAFHREGGSSRAESGPIRLEDGVVREIELVLSTADAEVTGIVADHNGDPVANAEVTIIGSGAPAGASPRSGPSWQTGADQRGRFQYRGLPAGAATIIASHPEYRVIPREIRLESGSNKISLTLQPGLDITGTLRSEDGLPIALGEIDAELQPAAGQHPLSDDVVWRRGGVHRSAHAVSDRNGDYRLAGLDTGVYTLRAWADGYGAGGPSHRVQLEGGSVAGVDLVLPAEATIEVRVAGASTSDPHVGAHQGHQYDNYRPATQDPGGAYRIEGLGPGDWTVTAQDSDGRRTEQTVSLSPGDEAVVELRFEEGLRLTGWVTLGGQPPGGGNVALVSGNLYPRWTELDRDGRFELRDVLPGVYDLTIGVPGAVGIDPGTIYERRIELQRDEDLRLDLEAPAVLIGLVRDTEGRALAGASLIAIAAGAGAAPPSAPGLTAVLSTQGMGGTAISGPDGRFELRSAPGPYDLHVAREGFETRTVTVDLAPAEHRQGLVFELRPASPSGEPQ